MATLSATLAIIILILAIVGPLFAIKQTRLADDNRILANQQAKLAGNNKELAVSEGKLRKDMETQLGIAIAEGHKARSSALAAQSAAVRETLPQRSVLLAAEAVHIWRNNQLPPVIAAEKSLRDSLLNLGGIGLCGHEGWVSTLAFSPDGRFLATGSENTNGPTTVRLWDLQAAEPAKTVRVLAGHEDNVEALTFSPDGRFLVSGSKDSTARLWDLRTEEPEKTVRVLQGHEDSVRMLAISPDGRFLVTGNGGEFAAANSNDKTARLWDLKAAEPEKTARILGHDGSVRALIFSPDGRYLVTGSQDRTARLWDLQAKEPEKTARILKGHEADVTELAISPDGRWLVTSVGNEVAITPDSRYVVTAADTARLWDLQLAEPEKSVRILRAHGSFSRKWDAKDRSSEFAVTFDSGAVRLWDLQTADPEKAPQVLTGHKELITCMSFSPDGRYLATGSQDQTVRLWDLRSPDRERLTLSSHGRLPSGFANMGIRDLEFIPNGRYLVTFSGGADPVRLWDLQASDLEARVLRGHDRDYGYGHVTVMAISPNGRFLVTGSGDKTARVWDLQAVEPEKSGLVIGIQVPRSGGDVAFSPDGRYLAIWGTSYSPSSRSSDSANRQRLLRFLNPFARRQGRLRKREQTLQFVDLFGTDPEKKTRELGYLTEGSDRVAGVVISPDGRFVVSGGYDETARLWDLQDTDPHQKARVLKGHVGPVRPLTISPDGRYLVTGSWEENTAILWDLHAAEPEKTARMLRGHEESVVAADISPDGRYLITGSNDKTVRLWDLRAKKPELNARVFRGHELPVTALAISPDSSYFVSVSHDWTARVWGLSEKNARVIKGHKGAIYSLAVSPNGRYLVTGGGDYTARIWDLLASETQRTARVLKGDDGPVVYHLAFSPDGRWLATASDRRVAWLWDLHAKDPEKTARMLRGHDGLIQASTITGDGRYIATASSGDGTVRLWPLEIEELLSQAERAAGRNFTVKEWEETFPDEEYRKTFAGLPKPAGARTIPEQVAAAWELNSNDPPVIAIIPAGSTWKWLHPTDGIDPAEQDHDFHTTFFTAAYDDSHWQTGQDSSGPMGGFGFGDPSGVSIGEPAAGHCKTAYFRHIFSVNQGFDKLALTMQRDDGVIMYIDGAELLRDNVDPSQPEAYGLLAEKSVMEGELNISPLPGGLEPGDHVLTISLHNRSADSRDLRIAEISLWGSPKEK